MAKQPIPSDKTGGQDAPAPAGASGGGPTIGGYLGLVTAIAGMMARLVVGALRAVTEDKALGEAANRGRTELASALKAFPDAVAVPEVGGGVWGPNEGKLAEYQPARPWPSEIAREARNRGDGGRRRDRGNDLDQSR